MSEITHDMAIKASSSTVFKALTTAQGLRSWFTTHVEGTGQPGTSWKLKFSDEPSFEWQIVSLENSRNLSWKCLQGPGNAPGTEAQFSLATKSDIECILTISHSGWPKDDPKFRQCVAIWRNLMEHLQRYCETGTPTPTYH